MARDLSDGDIEREVAYVDAKLGKGIMKLETARMPLRELLGCCETFGEKHSAY